MADDPFVVELVERFIRNQRIIDRVSNLLDAPQRLAATHNLNVTDEMRGRLDVICGDLSVLIRVPMCAVTLVDDAHQHVLGTCGMDPTSIARDKSYCIFVASSGKPFQVADIPVEDRDLLPAHRERRLRAYIGRPVMIFGQTIGALCAVDYHPREWTAPEMDLLGTYAQRVSVLLEKEQHDARV